MLSKDAHLSLQGIEQRLTPSASLVFGRFRLLSHPGFACAIGAVALVVIGIADYLTAFELRLAMLYLLPIGLVAWSAGAAWGTGFSAAATATWIAMAYSDHAYASDLYFFWESVELAAVFMIVVLLVSRLRRALERSDARFASNEARVEHADELADAFHAVLRKESADHWLPVFRAAKVPAGPINGVDEAFAYAEEQVRQGQQR